MFDLINDKILTIRNYFKVNTNIIIQAIQTNPLL